MLKSLQRLWEKALNQPDAGARAHSLELSVAALMVEIMRIDGKIEASEKEQILRQLQQAFSLSDQAAENLLRQADLITDEALDMHQFTSRIVNGFSTEERVEILQRLWRVAMADGRVDPHEEQLLRRMAELFGIDHRRFIGAKLAAADDSA